jgi:LPXTG-motif cell wall-anchored protein
MPCDSPGTPAIRCRRVTHRPLPATGQYNVRPIAVAGAAVLLIGIVLVIATRRRDGAKH